MKTYRPSLLLILLLATGCAAPPAVEDGDDPDVTEDALGNKPAPRDVTWTDVVLPRDGLDGHVTIDDIAFVTRPDGAPVTRGGGKPIVFVLERIGEKRLPQEPGILGPSVDPGVVLLLRSDDGAETFRTVTELPGLGVGARIHVAPVPRGRDVSRIYVEAPAEDTGGRGGPSSYHASLFRSDFGASFRTEQAAAADIAIDPADPNTLTGISCNGFMRSIDGGATWTSMTATPIADCGHPHVARTKDPNRLYAVFGLGDFSFPYFYRSDDAGRTFRQFPDSPPRALAKSSILVDDVDVDHVWAWDHHGFASSADGGATFVDHDHGLVPIGDPEQWYVLSNLVVDDMHRPPGQESHTLWLANGDRLVRWSPGADAWERVSTLPGEGKRIELAGRASSPKAFAVVRRGEDEALARGEFVYAP